MRRISVPMLTLALALLLIPIQAHAATLGNPGNGRLYSGIGVISGWKCEANGPLTVRFNGGESIPLVYGSQRPDVLEAGACAHDRAGFVAIWNWAILGDGEHTAVAYDNGVEFARSTFSVGTAGEEFVRGAQAQVWVENFPAPGEQARFIWNESTQHLELSQIDRGTQEPEPPSCEGWTTFESATAEWVQHCLDAGANPQARDENGWTALHRVAWFSQDDARAAKLLISAGANVNARADGGSTPLHLAASWPDNLAIVVALLDAGADPNAVNNAGHTPLYYHNNYGLNPEIERALINAGADPNIYPPGEPIECSTPECAAKLR